MAASALAALAAPAASRSADRPVAVLADLAAEPVVLAGGAAVTRAFAFPLPAGARQGPDVWYTIRLRYRITFAADSGAGFAWVMADTNGRTSAQVEYTVARDAGGLRVRETSVDIVNGQLEKRFRGRTSEVRFRNYLQRGGVRGGRNELTLRLEQGGAARVDRVEVLPESGVYRTGSSPYPLGIAPRLVAGRLQPGSTFRLVVALDSRTGEVLRDVAVQPAWDRRAFELVSPRVRRYATLARRVDAVFEFKALTAGRHRIDVLADSNRNHPSATVAVTVSEAPPGTALVVVVWSAALLPAALLVGWVVRGRIRRR